jgi:flagellar FliJ protein
MSANSSLLVVLESAQKARDEAVGELEGGKRAYDAARQQAQSLFDWRSEYQQRWQAQFRQVGGMEIMRCYQDFMLRLAEAISDQDKRVEQARLYMERCKALLIERERKVAAVAQLMDRRLVELQLKQNRQDQKATDEVASRAGRSGLGLGAGGSPLTSGSIG